MAYIYARTTIPVKTQKQTNLELVLPEYSHSKRVTVNPDIVYYYKESPEPMFDLIIGTETMESLRIVLDFKSKIVTIDQSTLPVRYVKDLQTNDAQKHVLASVYFTEPV